MNLFTVMLLLNKEQKVQECDATDDHPCYCRWYQKCIYYFPDCIIHTAPHRLWFLPALMALPAA